MMREKLGAAEISPFEVIFLTAYIDLDGEREYLRPIPWSAVINYAQFYEYDHTRAHELVYIIKSIDNVILPDRERKVKAANGNPP
jgi:hypothetical protein